MADPIQAVADAIRSTYFRPDGDVAYVDQWLAEQAADLAVAALKADPSALAALLDPVHQGTDGAGDWVDLDSPTEFDCYSDGRTLYRIPEAPRG